MSKSEAASALDISRGSLYYKPKIGQRDEELRHRIEAVMCENPAYGYRRVALELGINKKRAQRVMQKYNLKPARRAKTPNKPDDLGKEAIHYPDIAKRLCPITPEVIWASDFTYISYQGEFLYLCTVIDLFTKEVLGFSVMFSHSTELIERAFNKALLYRGGATPLWFHSDQGSEYTSDMFLSTLARNNIAPSLTPKASPWRNGSQESFFGRFKVEFGDFERFDNVSELIEAICIHISYYNNSRIHSTISDKPRIFHQKWIKQNKHSLSTAYQSPPRPPSLQTLRKGGENSGIYGFT